MTLDEWHKKISSQGLNDQKALGSKWLLRLLTPIGLKKPYLASTPWDATHTTEEGYAKAWVNIASCIDSLLITRRGILHSLCPPSLVISIPVVHIPGKCTEVPGRSITPKQNREGLNMRQCLKAGLVLTHLPINASLRRTNIHRHPPWELLHLYMLVLY